MTVWQIVAVARSGAIIQEALPGVSDEEIKEALNYFLGHREEIEREILNNTGPIEDREDE